MQTVERWACKAITQLLLCLLKTIILLHSLLKLRIALEQDRDGESHSWTWQGRSRQPPHQELQGVGGGAGFTEVHPGLLKCGSDLSPLPGEGCTSVSVRRLWARAGFRVWHPFCGSCAEAWGSCSGRGGFPSSLTAGCEIGIGGVLGLLCAVHGPANSKLNGEAGLGSKNQIN